MGSVGKLFIALTWCVTTPYLLTAAVTVASVKMECKILTQSINQSPFGRCIYVRLQSDIHKIEKTEQSVTECKLYRCVFSMHCALEAWIYTAPETWWIHFS